MSFLLSYLKIPSRGSLLLKQGINCAKCCHLSSWSHRDFYFFEFFLLFWDFFWFFGFFTSSMRKKMCADECTFPSMLSWYAIFPNVFYLVSFHLQFMSKLILLASVIFRLRIFHFTSSNFLSFFFFFLHRLVWAYLTYFPSPPFHTNFPLISHVIVHWYSFYPHSGLIKKKSSFAFCMF